MASIRPVTRLQAQSATVSGSAAQTITGTGVLVAQTAIVSGFAEPIAVDPVSLDFETPEQISFYAVVNGTVDEATVATVRYRKQGTSTWFDAAPLWRIEPQWALSSPPETVVDAFAGIIVDLDPGSTYEYEITFDDGSTQDIRTGTADTRALPADSGAATTTLSSPTASALASAINGADPGDVIEFSGEVALTDVLTISVAGTEGSPIYVRGNAQDTAIISRATDGSIFSVNATAANLIFERFTIEGSGNDSGTSASTRAFSVDDSAPVENLTLRNLLVTGVDRVLTSGGGSNSGDLRGLLVYDCVLEGNNPWTQASLESSDTWNDDGVRMQGQGNCVWNCDLSGFGDTFGFQQGVFTAACFQYRNRIRRSGDDAIEAEYCTRNCATYDNHVQNSNTALSIDGIYGGPYYYFRNRSINMGRQIIKCGSTTTGVLMLNNTFVKTTGEATAPGGIRGWYWSQTANANDWEYRNNLFLWEGANEIFRTDDTLANLLPAVITNNGWGRNSQNINFGTGGGGSSGTVAEVNDDLTPLFDDDFEVTNQAAVFETPVVLGANYLTEITTEYDLALKTASEAIGNGVDIANISKGTDVGARQFGVADVVYGNRFLGDSPLAVAAAAVTSGNVADFASGAISNTLADIDGTGTIYQWGVRFEHYEGKAWLIGKAPGPDVPTRLLSYDEASNTWTNEGDFFTGSFGHAYDGLTLDRNNNRPFYHRYNVKGSIEEWTGSGFTTRTLTPSTDSLDGAHNGAAASGLAWAPNLFGSGVPGIVWGHQGGAIAIDPSDFSAIQIVVFDSEDSLGNHTVCFYSPEHDCVFFGGGNNSNNLYRINNGDPPTSELRGAAPQDIGTDGHAKAGVFALGTTLYAIGDTNYHTSTNQGTSWSSATAVPFDVPANNEQRIAPTEYGVFWILHSVAQSQLWRP